MVATLRYPDEIARLYHERGGIPYIERIDVPSYADARAVAYQRAAEMNMPIELVWGSSRFVAYPPKLQARGY